MTISEETTLNLKDVYEYVLRHKGKYAYVGFSDRAILNDLRATTLDNLLLVDTNDSGDICGVVCAKYTDTYKVLHIKQLICTNKKSLPIFIRIFNKRFPDWRLTAIRSKKHFNLHKVSYNTTKLIRKVLYYG